MTLFINYLFTDPQVYFMAVVILTASVVLHELAHGFVAIRLGDDTPRRAGHMTANPVVHLGYTTIIWMLIFGFAWGNMPFDRGRLRGRHGDAIVCFAGPLINIALAFVSLTALGLLMRYPPNLPENLAHASENVQTVLTIAARYNMMLAIFNLLPIPPLDGAGILGSFHRDFGDAAENPGNAGMWFAFLIGAMLLFPFYGGPIIAMGFHYAITLGGG